MKRKYKCIILLVLSLTVIIVYQKTNPNSINYVVLGDSLSMGQNSYGGITYGYHDYIKDELNKTKKVKIIDIYTKKNTNITNLYYDILISKNINIDNINYNIKKVLREAEFITMSIGLNDIIYEYNIKTNSILTVYEENHIIDYICSNFLKLIKQIRSYTSKPIYIISYPVKNQKYNNLIIKLNNKYKTYCNKYNLIYIDTNKILNDDDFDQNNTIFPNTNGYKKIADEVLIKYKKSKN